MSEIGPPSSDYLAPVRAAVLAAALPHAPFDGWSQRMFEAAVRGAGVDQGLALLAFPTGVMDLLDAFWSAMDAAMAAEIARCGLRSNHISARISGAVKIYIGLLGPHREAVRRALALQALPIHAPGGLMRLYRTVDIIWRSIDDQSTDFNFYTKRATLAALVASVVTHWLGENNPDPAAMDAFIDRRIENVLAFEKAKARISGLMRHLPSPGRLAGLLAGAWRPLR